MYGGACIACGETDLVMLTLDHINDDGAIERKKSHALKTYKISDGKRSDLQCMCYNCNLGRKKAYGPDISTWKEKAMTVEEALALQSKCAPCIPLPPNTFKTRIEAHKQWRIRNKEKLRLDRLKTKAMAMMMHGGRCRFCKTNELAVLSIDHTNNDGGGGKRKLKGSALYNTLIRDKKREDLACMCLNCNLGRKRLGTMEG